MKISQGDATMIKTHLKANKRQRLQRLKVHLAELIDALIYLGSATLLVGKLKVKLTRQGKTDFIDD